MKVLVERYRSPRSGRIATMSLPRCSWRRARWTAAQAAAPLLIPHISPSCRARQRVISIGVFIAHADHFVENRQVQHVGNESGADTLDRMFARLQRLAGKVLRDDRAGVRLDGHDANARLAGL